MHSLTHTHTHSTHTHSTHSHSLTLTLTHSLAHSLTHLFCVAGVDNVHCQGVGCTPWRPLGSASFAWQAHSLTHSHSLTHLFCVAGVEQCALPRVGCTPWRPLGSASIAWQAWDNVHCQGVGCTPWRPLGSASSAWQVWGNVHCQGVGCSVPWAPPLLRGRRGTMCTAKGLDVRPGVFWAPPLSRGRRGTMCTAKGSDVPGVPWAPLLLRGRRGTTCTAKGSDVRPGVPWAAPLLRGRPGRLVSWFGLVCSGHDAGLWHLDRSLTHSLPLTPSHSLSLSLTHSFTYSLIHTPSLLYFLFPSCFSMLSPSLKKLVTCGVIRSFNLHWGKSFDFMAPADSVRRLEMQNFGLPQFCASFGVFSCGVGRSRYTCWSPIYNEERAERVPTLWLQTTPQETARCARWCHWTVRFVWCPFLELERHIEFGLPKAVLPSSARGCLCPPSCLLWFHGFWRTFEAAVCVPSIMSQPQNRIDTRSNAWIWRARFWSCLLLK